MILEHEGVRRHESIFQGSLVVFPFSFPSSKTLTTSTLPPLRHWTLPNMAPSPFTSALHHEDQGTFSTMHYNIRRNLDVNSTQQVTLGVIAAYVVIIALLWNLPYVRWSLWPFKMLVIAFHEFSHAATACCTGGKVESISLDPREGGVTHMRGGISAITLPAGYLGSSLIGALLIFCGFDIVASKVASIALGVCFLLTLWWARKDWLTIVTVLLSVGLLIACWFIKHAEPLRFVVLFIGVMSALYSVWDIVSTVCCSTILLLARFASFHG